MDRRSFVVGTAAFVAAGPTLAQETFPSHAITIINAFPPGGINDIVTRPLASMMEPLLKQPVVVETKAGAAILTPAFFAGVAPGPSSMRPLFDRSVEAGRLCGLRLEGVWMHVGTPDAIKAAEEAILESAA